MEKLFRPNPKSFKNTFCVFQEIPLDRLEGLTIQYSSKSGSTYYYDSSGMFRLSNHWGRLANSKWRLVPLEPETAYKVKLGFAAFENFYPDNSEDKLYYIEANYEKNSVTYQHKNNPNYDNKAILRTSFDTAKRIKQIRNLQQLTSWATYFEYEDLAALRQNIITQLIHTNLALDEIKRAQHEQK